MAVDTLSSPIVHDDPDPEALDPVFAIHKAGKLSVQPRVEVEGRGDLSLVYTPGVARVSSAIAAVPELARTYTWVSNTVAVVTDGTAVLGLGDIGPRAAMPVMEGKALLFKQFADIDAVPICLDCTDVDEIVETVARIAPSFGGIDLEDIAAPRCFEIEERLQQRLDIPVFHDDQHGTAIVVAAALRNALKVVGKRIGDVRIVVSGCGAAGVAVTSILLAEGARRILVVDRAGIVSTSRADLNGPKRRIAALTNPDETEGDIADVLAGADVLIGLSGGHISERAIAGMASRSVIFALANPTPEVHPTVAHRYASVVATGSSEFPNQINNVLAFPGLFRGALDTAAHEITPTMKQAAIDALEGLVGMDRRPDYVIPDAFDPRVAPTVAACVARATLR
jgi:malate dehydrogenase (oxaloacetate-decarboxylating)